RYYSELYKAAGKLELSLEKGGQLKRMPQSLGDYLQNQRTLVGRPEDEQVALLNQELGLTGSHNAVTLETLEKWETGESMFPPEQLLGVSRAYPIPGQTVD